MILCLEPSLVGNEVPLKCVDSSGRDLSVLLSFHASPDVMKGWSFLIRRQ